MRNIGLLLIIFNVCLELEQSFLPIYSELRTIHPDLHSTDDTDGVTAARVFNLLSLLGVKDLNFSDIIYHHIIPQFKEKEVIMVSEVAFVL